MAKAKANRKTKKQATTNEAKSEQGTQMRTGNGKTQKAQATALSRRDQSMPAVLNSPFSFLRRFGEDMEQLFEEFGFGGLMPRGMAQGLNQIAGWTPQVEIFRRDGQLVIRADLPGVDKDNVQIELRDDSVVIRGERQEEHEEKREGFYRSERAYGSFYREIPLPQGVNTENATANFRDGVLEITMPARQGESQSRQLKIEDAQVGRKEQAKAQTA
jgi:HSP20 family protein